MSEDQETDEASVPSEAPAADDAVAAPAEPQAEAARRAQSTIQFPYNDLDDAVVVARKVWDPYGGECEIGQLAGALGQKPKSGAFRTKVLAAKGFGLVQGSQNLVLTPLGRKMVDGLTERSARVEAFLKVQLFKAIYDQATQSGGMLPTSSNALEALIGRLGVVDNQRENARQVFLRSAAQAGFFDHGKDRLVKPALPLNGGSSGADVEEKLDPPPPPSDNVKVETHPLMVGLLQSLPPRDKPFSAKQRARWLKAVRVNFDFIYGPTEDGDEDAMEAEAFKE